MIIMLVLVPPQGPMTVIYTSCPINILEASGISKQDMCDSLRTLAGCTSDSSCTINSDCTCISFSITINSLTIRLTIYIVDPCAKHVCFNMTSESYFSRTVCNDTDIKFKMSQTFTFGSRQISLKVPTTIAVRLVHMSPSKVQMTVSCIQQCIAIYNTRYY